MAGYQDDNSYVYANWSEAPNCSSLAYDANVIPQGVPTQKESAWQAPDNFHPPVKTMYTVPPNYNFSDNVCGGESAYICWPTISPGSIAYYPENGAIPGWGNSLLVTGMKNGALYRFRLHADKKTVQGDVEKYFHTNNRYRMVLVSPDGKDLYIATDVRGNVMGVDGKVTNNLQNPGSILKFTLSR